MGMDLNGAGGNFRFNRTSWFFILRLAHKYGWQPRGTAVTEVTLGALGLKDRSDVNWDGTYFANEWQEVGDEDVLNIANALEKALPAVPNQKNKNMQNLINHEKWEDIDPLEYWSGKGNKAYIKKFIKYCREGSFLIG